MRWRMLRGTIEFNTMQGQHSRPKSACPSPPILRKVCKSVTEFATTSQSLFPEFALALRASQSLSEIIGTYQGHTAMLRVRKKFHLHPSTSLSLPSLPTPDKASTKSESFPKHPRSSLRGSHNVSEVPKAARSHPEPWEHFRNFQSSAHHIPIVVAASSPQSDPTCQAPMHSRIETCVFNMVCSSFGSLCGCGADALWFACAAFHFAVSFPNVSTGDGLLSNPDLC